MAGGGTGDHERHAAGGCAFTMVTMLLGVLCRCRPLAADTVMPRGPAGTVRIDPATLAVSFRPAERDEAALPHPGPWTRAGDGPDRSS